jgi:hypothetical protein
MRKSVLFRYRSLAFGVTALLSLSVVALGQTVEVAPGTQAGRTITIHGQWNKTHTNLRAYMGDFNAAAGNGLPARGGIAPDEARALDLRRSQRVIIDRSAMMWGIDKNLAIWGYPTSWVNQNAPTRDIVVRRTINALSLNENRHPRQPKHGNAALIGYNASRVLIWESLHAHHWARALFDITVDRNDVHVEAANVVVYNWGLEAFKVGMTPHAQERGHRAKISLRGCVFVIGPDTQEWNRHRWFAFGVHSGNYAHIRHPVYVEDCWVVDQEGNWTDLREWLSDEDRAALVHHPHWIDFSWAGYNPSNIRRALPSMVEELLKEVGPEQRNWIEQMVVDDVLGRTGRIINSQDDLLEQFGDEIEQTEVVQDKAATWVYRTGSAREGAAEKPASRVGDAAGASGGLHRSRSATEGAPPENTNRIDYSQGETVRRSFRK